jgi:uncharacterized Zn ribbon protein
MPHEEMKFGSIAGGLPPCANCETEPVGNGDSPFCSPECRNEYEGVEPTESQKNAEAFRSMYD